jgi:hypothetical protein
MLLPVCDGRLGKGDEYHIRATWRTGPCGAVTGNIYRIFSRKTSSDGLQKLVLPKALQEVAVRPGADGFEDLLAR